MKVNQWIISLCTLLLVTSCSMHFEKRRYRTGYHVEIIQHHSRINKVSKQNDLSSVKISTGSTVIIPVKNSSTNLSEPVPLNFNIDPVIEKKSKMGFRPIIKSQKKVTIGRELKNQHFRKRLFETKKTHGLTGRKIAAWILGAAGLILFIVGCALSGSLIGYFGIIFGLSGGVFFAIIALLARFVGVKKEKENKELHPEGPIPVKPGFITGSFIFSIITVSLALISFIFGFFIPPFGIIGISLASVAMACSIIAMVFGFRILGPDKGIRTKLILIFAFVAFLIALMAMILILVL